MKVALSHSELKFRREVAYYVHCKIQFNEEEKAIIRERSLGESTLNFFSGFVNRDPASYRRSSQRTLFWLGLLSLFFGIFLFPGALKPIGSLLLIAAVYCFTVRWWRNHHIADDFISTVPVKEIVYRGGFSVSNYGLPPKAQEIEDEMRFQLESLKALLTASTVRVSQSVFEL